ncbi:MAG: diaminopimelate epimerase [Candidatus Omnitrophota bacterium]
MVNQIEFTKMVASGNDFAVIEKVKLSAIRYPLSAIAKRICDRKYGVGADGLLLLEKSNKADIRMRIFNPDGSEPRMCGNAVTCASLYSAANLKGLSIETKAGIIEAKVNRDRVKIKMTEPKDIKLGLPIKIAPQARHIKVNFIDTGVPHAVIFVEGLDKIDIVDIGRQIRFHKIFRPQGTNVDFVQILDDNNIRVRTYERGVEDETLACGTGTVAAALLYAIRKINVHTKSGEVLGVEFEKVNRKFNNVWLEGKARIVHTGVYYV